MHFTKAEILRLLALLALYGTIFTFLSTAYRSRHHFPTVRDFGIEAPELDLRVRHMPGNVTAFGFPMAWFINTEGATYVGRQVTGTYSEFSICWSAFLGDVLFYAVIFSPVVYFRFLAAKSRRCRPSAPVK